MSIYNNLFELVNTYIFGGLIVDGSYEELIAIVVSSFGCIFLVALPFLLVWRIIKIVL